MAKQTEKTSKKGGDRRAVLTALSLLTVSLGVVGSPSDTQANLVTDGDQARPSTKEGLQVARNQQKREWDDITLSRGQQKTTTKSTQGPLVSKQFKFQYQQNPQKK
jgi:hypothetical protein